MSARVLALATFAMTIAAALMIALDANAYAPATDPIQTAPQFDCWQDENGDWAGCRLTENDR